MKLYRYRLSIPEDKGDESTERTEWYAAAYLADKYRLLTETCGYDVLYIRGTQMKLGKPVVRMYADGGNGHACEVVIQGLYWGTPYSFITTLFEWPYGNPLAELLVGTFKASEGTAKRITEQGCDWVYQLDRPKMRKVQIALEHGIRLTHELAMRVIGR